MAKEKLTSEEVMNMLNYDNGVSEKNSFLTAFYGGVRNADRSSFLCLLQHQNNYRWFQK